MDFYFGAKKNKRMGPCGPGLVLSPSARGRLCVKEKPKGPTVPQLREQAQSLGLSVYKRGKDKKIVLADKTTLIKRINRALRESGLASSFGRKYKYTKGMKNKRMGPCGPGLRRAKFQKGRACVKDLPKVTLLDLQRQALAMGLSIYKKKKDGSDSASPANKRTLKLRISRALNA